MKHFFWDDLDRRYCESSKDIATYDNVDEANSTTTTLFEPFIAHYSGYPQYRNFDSYDEHGCLTSVICCTQGTEPRGRRWKTTVATELRTEHHVDTLERNSSLRRYQDSEDNDPKDDDTKPSRFRSKLKSGFQRFANHMCMGANGHRAEEDQEQPFEDSQTRQERLNGHDDTREFLSSLLNLREDTYSKPDDIHSEVFDDLVRRHGGDNLLRRALLACHARRGMLTTTTIPLLTPDQSQTSGTCSLGFMITTNGPNSSTTFTKIHSEKFTTDNSFDGTRGRVLDEYDSFPIDTGVPRPPISLRERMTFSDPPKTSLQTPARKKYRRRRRSQGQLNLSSTTENPSNAQSDEMSRYATRSHNAKRKAKRAAKKRAIILAKQQHRARRVEYAIKTAPHQFTNTSYDCITSHVGNFNVGRKNSTAM